jgi:hypothetical protein
MMRDGVVSRLVDPTQRAPAGSKTRTRPGPSHATVPELIRAAGYGGSKGSKHKEALERIGPRRCTVLRWKPVKDCSRGTGNSPPRPARAGVNQGTAREEIWASPHDPARARRILEREAAALRRCEDALGGDFVRFAEAVARLHQDGNA